MAPSEPMTLFQAHQQMVGDIAAALAEPFDRSTRMRRLPFKRPGEKDPAAYIPGEFVILDLNTQLPLLWSSRVTNVAYPEPLTQRKVPCASCDPGAQKPTPRERCLACVNCEVCDGKAPDVRKACKSCTNGRTGKILRWFCTAAVTVRLIIGPISAPWCEREDLGVCSANAQVDPGAAADLATKGATTDGLKRAAALLGPRFGLALRFSREEQDMLKIAVGEEAGAARLGAMRGKTHAPAGIQRSAQPTPTPTKPPTTASTPAQSRAAPAGAPSGARSSYTYPKTIERTDPHGPAAAATSGVSPDATPSSGAPEPFACTICGSEKPSLNSPCPEQAHHPKPPSTSDIIAAEMDTLTSEALAAVGVVTAEESRRAVGLHQGGSDTFACAVCGNKFFTLTDPARRRYACTGCGTAFDAELGDVEVPADTSTSQAASATDQATTTSTPVAHAPADASGGDAEPATAADLNLVPDHLRAGLDDLDAPLVRNVLNDLHAVLVDRAGSRPKANAALKRQGVVAAAGNTASLRQFLGAFKDIAVSSDARAEA